VKRLLVALLLFALPLVADDRPGQAYSRGVDAVRAKNYAAGAEALQRAIAEVATENGALRVRNEIITYVPHYWLGIAKFNLGDVDAALREWKLSEEQGVVQSTPYYASLRDWVARAQSQKQQNSESAAAASRNAANSAMSTALRARNDAVAAGADRTDAYRAAQRKLDEARQQFQSAGTDPRAYRHAEEVAVQARTMFAATAEDARKQRAARVVQVAKQTAPAVVQPQPQPQPVAAPQPARPTPVPVPVMPATVTATVAETKPAPPVAAPPVESEALVEARLALQQYRRKLVDQHASHAQLKDAQSLEAQLRRDPNPATIKLVMDRVAAYERASVPAPVAAPPVAVAAKATVTSIADPSLQVAYRAYAAGDLARADELLSKLVASSRSPEALLLRGCTRYTRAMLSRGADLTAAKADLTAALSLNRALRLDARAFSPKLVAYFDALKR
jgi:hypothetical protein